MKETYSFWFCNDVKIQIDMYTNETSEAGQGQHEEEEGGKLSMS